MSQELTCTICQAPFDIDLEGGANGYIGIIPCSFCPTCYAGLVDMAGQEEEEEEEEPDDDEREFFIIAAPASLQ